MTEEPRYKYPIGLLNEIIYFLGSKKPYFEDFAKFRMRCEGWVRVEVLRFLSVLLEKKLIEDFEPEKSYDSGRCDIFFKVNGRDYWMEIKTFPTNYCRYFSRYKSKPITKFVRDAKNDLEKLKEVEDVGGDPIFLLLAYPIPDITVPLPDSMAIRRWWSHLEKLKETGFQSIIESSIPLEERVECKIYIFMRGYPSKMLTPYKKQRKKPKLRKMYVIE